MEDLAGNFLLLPAGSTLVGVNPGTSDYLGVYSSVVAPGHCTGNPSTTVPNTFDGLVSWLEDNEALDITNMHDASVGGLTGVVMDLAMAGRGDECDFESGFADVIVGTPPSSLVHSVGADYPLRLYLLQDRNRTLAIEIADAPDGGSDYADWFTAADDVVATFEFAAGG